MKLELLLLFGILSLSCHGKHDITYGTFHFEDEKLGATYESHYESLSEFCHSANELFKQEEPLCVPETIKKQIDVYCEGLKSQIESQLKTLATNEAMPKNSDYTGSGTIQGNSERNVSVTIHDAKESSSEQQKAIRQLAEKIAGGPPRKFNYEFKFVCSYSDEKQGEIL
ncbi:hypothetical protein [Pleionea sp. CnH1-48]|uniref:hypothetical protein n=1 Tax=Pleionea sp. CnH1-48 TaxID=2954494 RepID=UPI002097CE70|nr:hypothetical protein [Pleionea sp. CnH1-48]MCO7223520.1 hypothetical protein [Pleionea sp. CnH1-48]